MASVAVLVVGAPIVYLLSKALKLRPKPITIENPKREVTSLLLVVIAEFVVVSALNVFMNVVLIPTFRLEQLAESSLSFDAIRTLWMAFFFAMTLVPVVLAIKRSGQNL